MTQWVLREARRIAALAEAYRIDVSSNGATISARTTHGLFNGAQTLAQLATQTDKGWVLPAVAMLESRAQ